MIKLIKAFEMTKMPWKNGLGITSEIAIHPQSARFPHDEFNWRLSCAEIKTSNVFSEFKDFDRILVVWKGDGIILNGIHVEPFIPYKFSGEKTARCELVQSEVVDVGLIYRRHLFNCEMKVVHTEANEQNSLNFQNGDVNFIFCAKGLINVHGFFLQSGDILQVEGQIKSEILSASKATYIAIKLEDVRS